MILELKRTTRTDHSTIGELSINGKFFCYTLEDVDRGLTSEMTLEEVKKKKIAGETAIPTGTYTLAYVYSPKHKKNLWLICDVHGYIGVEIHVGNFPKDTLGCILLGAGKEVDKITGSTITLTKFMSTLDHNEHHTITIK